MQRHDNNKKPIRLPKVVAEIGKLNLDGNIIPHSWYEHIKLASGATDLVGIIILSEIVYWYRPYELLAERSGQPSYHKKFAGDMFQSAAGYYEQKFGLTKDQTRKALKRLEDNGLIRREYREVVQRGVRMNNVMFIEPIPDKIAEITYSALEDETLAEPPAVQPPAALSLVPKDACSLIFDYALKDLSEAQRNPIRQKLAGVSMPLAQHILDELNSNVGQGAVKARKPYLRYLDKLIARATGNDLEPFVPTSDLPDRRRKAASIEHAKAESERKALEKLRTDQETEPKRNPSAGSGRRGPPGGSIKAMLEQERLKNAK